jgi:hypothetical protein
VQGQEKEKERCLKVRVEMGEGTATDRMFPNVFVATYVKRPSNGWV